MAATVAAAKAMLKRMGLSDPVCDEITSALGQNLSQVEDFADLSESDIKMLFSSLKNPGGLNAAGTRNYGHSVNMIGQRNVAAMCFLAKHMLHRLDRPLTHADIQMTNVNKARAMQVQEMNHSDPAVVPVFDAKNWPKTMELLETYIGGYRAQDGSSMGWIIRHVLFPPSAASDPPYGAAGSAYNSPLEETNARHKIVNQSLATNSIADHEKWGPFTDEYICDRGKVFDIINLMFASLPGALTIIKPHKKSRDGRGAFMALYNHYLGPNNVDNMAGTAEKTLANLVYRGQSSRYGIEQHVLGHKAAHVMLEGLMDHGYQGIDERSKVRYLMDSIKTMKLDAPKAQIMASPELRTNFDACATLFKDFVSQANMNDHSNERQVSALSGNILASTRYVPTEQWNALSQDERDAVDDARKNARKLAAERAAEQGRSRKRGKGGDKTDSHHKKKLSKIQKVAAKWSKAEQKVAKAAIKGMKGDDSDDEHDVKMKEGDDGHNMRQKKGQK